MQRYYKNLGFSQYFGCNLGMVCYLHEEPEIDLVGIAELLGLLKF